LIGILTRNYSVRGCSEDEKMDCVEVEKLVELMGRTSQSLSTIIVEEPKFCDQILERYDIIHILKELIHKCFLTDYLNIERILTNPTRETALTVGDLHSGENHSHESFKNCVL
jgi:hypothetical protein